MRNTILEIVMNLRKTKKEKELTRFEKVMCALLEADQDRVKGALSTEDAMLLVEKIFTLSEVNQILTNENGVLREENIAKELMIDKLKDDNLSDLKRLDWALKGAERLGKQVKDAERTIRMGERANANCHKDIMKVYGYCE